MEKRMREAVRYLGYGKSAVDERIRGMISEAFDMLKQAACFRSVCRTFDMRDNPDGTIEICGMHIRSKSLSRNLKGCRKSVLFAATLGAGVDRLITRTAVTDMAMAVVLQACAAAMLEENCDILQEKIRKEMLQEGLYLRPRFSPGYGDFDISFQKDIMAILESPKKIGLTLTDSYMMTPTKSVTALIGAGETLINCPVSGCEECGRTDCVYRR